MNTVGWILILLGLLIVRFVYKGRVLEMGDDLSDAILALIRSDTKALAEVFSREGTANKPSAVNISLFNPELAEGGGQIISGIGSGIDQGAGAIQRTLSNSVALAAVMLGEKAKGYRWGATGPDYYDCSGLIWRACLYTKNYSGARFTTATFASMARKYYMEVPFPMVDDIVVWPNATPGHMGVVVGTDKFYSALSERSGIGERTISNFSKTKPKFYRRIVKEGPGL